MLAFGVVVCPPHDDGVEGAVELTISSTVEAVAYYLARRGGDWCHSRKGCKGSIRANPSAVGPSADDLSCADGTDTRFSGERGSEFINQLGQLLLAGSSFGTQCFSTSRDKAQSLARDLKSRHCRGRRRR